MRLKGDVGYKKHDAGGTCLSKQEPRSPGSWSSAPFCRIIEPGWAKTAHKPNPAHCFFLEIKFYWKHSHARLLPCNLFVAFMLLWQSWVVVTKAIRPRKPIIFTIWHVGEKVCQSRPRASVSWLSLSSEVFPFSLVNIASGTPYAKHCFRYFINTQLLNPGNNSMRWILFSPFFWIRKLRFRNVKEMSAGCDGSRP